MTNNVPEQNDANTGRVELTPTGARLVFNNVVKGEWENLYRDLDTFVPDQANITEVLEGFVAALTACLAEGMVYVIDKDGSGYSTPVLVVDHVEELKEVLDEICPE